MRILITNDDCITSPILPILAKWALKHGEVTLVAPKTEQSAKSQSIDFHHQIEVKKVDLVEGIECYTVDSTPADCVRFAVTGLKREFDLVISGVNRGYNLGWDIAYSGTVGAILEAHRYGINGLALSTDFDILLESEQYFDTVFEYINERKLYDYNELYNVNIPHGTPKGIRMTKMGKMFYTDEFTHIEGDMYQQFGGPVKREFAGIDTDIDAVQSGYISVTPIQYDKTNMKAFEQLK